MKLRSFEITRDGSDKYTIKVDGKTAEAGWNKAIFDSIEKYHGVDINDEVIATIIHELDREFNLTETELDTYTQTLKHILED